MRNKVHADKRLSGVDILEVPVSECQGYLQGVAVAEAGVDMGNSLRADFVAVSDLSNEYLLIEGHYVK